MALVIPDLATSGCRLVGTCGAVQAENPTVLEWLKAHDGWRSYRLEQTEGVIYYARVAMGGKTGRHCHIDLATADYFEGHPPETQRGSAELDEILRPITGSMIAATLRGFFVLPLEPMPSIVKELSRAHGTKRGTTVRMTGGKMSIEGQPLESLSWEIEKESLHLIVQARATLPFTDDYLADALKFADAGRLAFIEDR